MTQPQPARFSIRQAADLLGVHPQTLRLYEREGLIRPLRTRGNTRRYALHDIERIRVILHLTRTLGINLAGVAIILDMQRKLAELEYEIQDLQHLLADQAKRQNRRYAIIKASSRMLIKVS